MDRARRAYNTYFWLGAVSFRSTVQARVTPSRTRRYETTVSTDTSACLRTRHRRPEPTSNRPIDLTPIEHPLPHIPPHTEQSGETHTRPLKSVHDLFMALRRLKRRPPSLPPRKPTDIVDSSTYVCMRVLLTCSAPPQPHPRKVRDSIVAAAPPLNPQLQDGQEGASPAAG